MMEKEEETESIKRHKEEMCRKMFDKIHHLNNQVNKKGTLLELDFYKPHISQNALRKKKSNMAGKARKT